MAGTSHPSDGWMNPNITLYLGPISRERGIRLSLQYRVLGRVSGDFHLGIEFYLSYCAGSKIPPTKPGLIG
jgi:hypothetical protein